jgi:hypothetical protein
MGKAINGWDVACAVRNLASAAPGHVIGTEIAADGA